MKKSRRPKKRRVENLKESFRKSPEWSEFRTRIAELFNHQDYLTGRRLTKGYNVHHLKTGQDVEGYCDISDETKFMPLNRYSHKLLHYVFTYYRKDKSILDRLREVLDRMCELEQEEKEATQIQQN